MARGRGSNTGRGNYPASKLPIGSSQIKEGIKSIKQPRYPNRVLSTTQYKKGLKKEESDV